MQLCINYANEKLQQFFNVNTFKDEEEVYLTENITSVGKLNYPDNQDVLDLIEGRPYGLLILLDEELRLPRGDDLKWLSKCHQYHSKQPRWSAGTESSVRIDQSMFEIKHFAARVQYSCEGFCEKNRDNLCRDLYHLMSNHADHPNFKLLFPARDQSPRRVDTLCGNFRKNLSDLMTLLKSTKPRFIRCIKPNNSKRQNTFRSKSCLEQLTCAGVLEAIRIRKQGYPFRLTHRRFACRYYPILRRFSVAKGGGGGVAIRPNENSNIDEFKMIRSSVFRGPANGGGAENKDHDLAVCRAILSQTGQDFDEVVIGTTSVLYRATEHRLLELMRNLALEEILPCTQRYVRRYIGKKYLKALKLSITLCRESLRNCLTVEGIEETLDHVVEVMAPFSQLFDYTVPDIIQVRERVSKLKERYELTGIFKDLLDKDVVEYYNEFVCAIQRAELICDVAGTEDAERLEYEIKKKVRAVARDRIDPWAEEALDLLDQPQMALVLKEADSLGYTTKTIEKIRTTLQYSEDYLVKLQLKRAQELGDPVRVINREIRLKDIFLNMYGAQFSLNNTRHNFLRDPMEWATMRFLGFKLKKASLATQMLYHTNSPIHMSLTRLDAASNVQVVSGFKNLMGWMGDRKYSCKCPLYPLH